MAATESPNTAGGKLFKRPARINRMEAAERFWPKVDKRDDDCWEWTGAILRSGYGQFRMNDGKERAHRAVMMLEGLDPGDDMVLHHCDNKACVNPAHLYVGGHEDNTRDVHERERFGHGQENGNSKLSRYDVEEIRSRYDLEDVSYAELAEDYGVTDVLIGKVVKIEVWRHL